MFLQVTELFSDHLERALAGNIVAAQKHAAEIRIRALGYVNASQIRNLVPMMKSADGVKSERRQAPVKIFRFISPFALVADDAQFEHQAFDAQPAADFTPLQDPMCATPMESLHLSQQAAAKIRIATNSYSPFRIPPPSVTIPEQTSACRVSGQNSVADVPLLAATSPLEPAKRATAVLLGGGRWKASTPQVPIKVDGVAECTATCCQLWPESWVPSLPLPILLVMHIIALLSGTL